jgi:hypothetical protein
MFPYRTTRRHIPEDRSPKCLCNLVFTDLHVLPFALAVTQYIQAILCLSRVFKQHTVTAVKTVCC